MIILIIAGIVWSVVFTTAVNDFISAGLRPHRAVWVGRGEFEVFGISIPYQFEGYLDYDFYYVTWGDQLLSGYLPYTDEFQIQVINNQEYNITYFFPPLYVYMCALGNALPIKPIGTGLIISLFGFITAFPLYGLARYLSENQKVAEIATATYLFNPLILYHTTFNWLNPAPFVFFVFLSFFLLVHDHRTSGVLAMATAALFKQTAFFFAIPVLAYVMRVAPKTEISDDVEDESNDSNTSSGLPSDRLDIKSFAKLTLTVIIYAAIISFPYILDPLNYLYYLFIRPGGMYLEDVTKLPGLGTPITLPVPFIAIGSSESFGLFDAFDWYEGFVELVNVVVSSTIALMIGIIPLMLLILIEVKDDENLRGYWKRILYLTMMMTLWIHITSPRGIFKYYLVLLIPFFSLLSTASMCSHEDRPVGPSIFNILLPVFFTLVLLIPSRHIYLLFLIMIFLFYGLQKHIGLLYGRIKGSYIQRVKSLRTATTPVAS